MGPHSIRRGNSALGRVQPGACRASMGPRSIRRGNMGTPIEMILDARRFNGATLNQAWKRVATNGSADTRTRSHAQSGVETGRRFNGATLNQAWKRATQWGHAQSDSGAAAGTVASMGPRSIRRGNSLVASNHPVTRTLCGYVPLRLNCSTSRRVHYHPRRSISVSGRLRKVRELRTYERHHRSARNQVWATLDSHPRVLAQVGVDSGVLSTPSWI